ncbi:MAG: (d)CMP kinase [Bacteroidetes bacterium]|nr:(d)CMP kinase [Bacteroidota bacterium]
MNKRITIAIDGYSSCGKSTLAKALASKLAYAYLDTGAMYRAVTLHMLHAGIAPADTESISLHINTIDIKFVIKQESGEVSIWLNGIPVDEEIRSMEVNRMVSRYAAIIAVRRAMVVQQQALGANGGVVLDGRDIGTVVFPRAELKIFMTASPEIRAQRRYQELTAAGKMANLDEIAQNLAERDHIDSTRQDSPLKQAADAKVLDNSGLTVDQQLAVALGWAHIALESR